MLYLLGDVIKSRRLARGFTQAELAAMVGATLNTLQKWEQGIRDPGTKRLIRLARACDMPLSAFVSLLDAVEVP